LIWVMGGGPAPRTHFMHGKPCRGTATQRAL
jgi:hypothetical protein